jgi:hypothetical protein
LNDYLLKDAAKALGINYSTAKTILRIFRIEKRIEKKNADEERALKDLIFKFKSDKNEKNGIFQKILNKGDFLPNENKLEMKSRNDRKNILLDLIN